MKTPKQQQPLQSVLEQNPSKQGLKRTNKQSIGVFPSKVLEQNPSKQGLKLPVFGIFFGKDGF